MRLRTYKFTNCRGKLKVKCGFQIYLSGTFTKNLFVWKTLAVINYWIWQTHFDNGALAKTWTAWKKQSESWEVRGSIKKLIPLQESEERWETVCFRFSSVQIWHKCQKGNCKKLWIINPNSQKRNKDLPLGELSGSLTKSVVFNKHFFLIIKSNKKSALWKEHKISAFLVQFFFKKSWILMKKSNQRVRS